MPFRSKITTRFESLLKRENILKNTKVFPNCCIVQMDRNLLLLFRSGTFLHESCGSTKQDQGQIEYCSMTKFVVDVY